MYTETYCSEYQVVLKCQDEYRQNGRRKDFRRSCLISTYYAVDGRCYNDFIQNISLGGVFIQTRHTFTIGQEILMTIPFPHTPKSIKIRGEVVRTACGGIGVRFKKRARAEASENDVMTDLR
jgi:Tfp pilus assembly protein PilZ